MNNNIYLLALTEATNYTDRAAFVSDLALSSAWGDAEDADIPESRLDWLGQIWDAAHRSYKDVAAAAGMSQRELARRFCVPYKTIEGWQSGRHEPPRYVLLMMQENLGLLHRKQQGDNMKEILKLTAELEYRLSAVSGTGGALGHAQAILAGLAAAGHELDDEDLSDIMRMEV